MNHPIHSVVAFEIVSPYGIRLNFEDGLERTVDFEPVLAGEILGPLHDPLLFAQVRIDAETRTLVWPNGADFDPATLHDWPQYADEFAARAKQWQLAPS